MWKPHWRWWFFLWHWWPPHNIFKLLICRVLAQFYYTEGSITEGYSPQAHLFSTCWHCMLNNPYTLVCGLCSLPPNHCIIAPLTNFYSPTLSRLWKLHIISLGPMGRWASVGMGDRTLPHTPGSHQHSSKPWDGAWKGILVSLCFSFSLLSQMPHRCWLLLPMCRLKIKLKKQWYDGAVAAGVSIRKRILGLNPLTSWGLLCGVFIMLCLPVFLYVFGYSSLYS